MTHIMAFVAVGGVVFALSPTSTVAAIIDFQTLPGGGVIRSIFQSPDADAIVRPIWKIAAYIMMQRGTGPVSLSAVIEESDFDSGRIRYAAAKRGGMLRKARAYKWQRLWHSSCFKGCVKQIAKQRLAMVGSDGEEGIRWYVLRTKPRQEERAHANLMAWNVESYMPLIHGHKAGSGKGAHPLFPNYLFARFSAGRMLHKLMLARGVQYVVAFGGRPAEVDDGVIAALRAAEGAAEGAAGSRDAMKSGDRIRVLSGPFQRFEGVFSEGCDSRRVMILLDALNQAALVIQRELIERVN